MCSCCDSSPVTQRILRAGGSRVLPLVFLEIEDGAEWVASVHLPKSYAGEIFQVSHGHQHHGLFSFI